VAVTGQKLSLWKNNAFGRSAWLNFQKSIIAARKIGEKNQPPLSFSSVFKTNWVSFLGLDLIKMFSIENKGK